MTKMRVGGLYRLKCGAIAKESSPDRYGRYSFGAEFYLDIVESCGGDHQSACSHRYSYAYNPTGHWIGRERDKDFDLHVEKEIEP